MEFVHSLLILYQMLVLAHYSNNARVLIRIKWHVIRDRMFAYFNKQLLMELILQNAYLTLVPQRLKVQYVNLSPFGINHRIKFVY